MSPSSLRGTYALWLELDQETVITVGRLGSFSFPAGFYVYTGSALGPGGLSARLARHRRAAKKLHWHIDYFLAYARWVDVVTDSSSQKLECAWASRLLSLPGASAPAPRFGASDCRCRAHLIYLGRGEERRTLSNVIARSASGDEAISAG